jgi:hypothetical protein
MNDPHLNIFYSYNRDNELIEDNLTRAFIVTLSLLSPVLLAQFIFRLLNNYSTAIDKLEFAKVRFALQRRPMKAELLRNVTHKFILTITGDGVIHGMDGEDDNIIFDKVMVNESDRPDAWIYDHASLPPKYCFLIESKKIYNNLSAEQVIGYSKDCYGTNSIEEFKQSLINVTWYDVLEVCNYLCEIKDKGIINPQELSILDHLKEFLGFYGISSYSGWNINVLPTFPDYNFIDFGLKQIPALPSYILKITKT